MAERNSCTHQPSPRICLTAAPHQYPPGRLCSVRGTVLLNAAGAMNNKQTFIIHVTTCMHNDMHTTCLPFTQVGSSAPAGAVRGTVLLNAAGAMNNKQTGIIHVPACMHNYMHTTCLPFTQVGSAAPAGTVRGTVLLNAAGAMNNKGVVGDWRILALYPLLLFIDFLLSIPAVSGALFNNVRCAGRVAVCWHKIPLIARSDVHVHAAMWLDKNC